MNFGAISIRLIEEASQELIVWIYRPSPTFCGKRQKRPYTIICQVRMEGVIFAFTRDDGNSGLRKRCDLNDYIINTSRATGYLTYKRPE